MQARKEEESEETIVQCPRIEGPNRDDKDRGLVMKKVSWARGERMYIRKIFQNLKFCQGVSS